MRKMILTAMSILAMVIMVSISTASAEKRHIVIEMGEGGQTVSFPMTAEEITAIDAENSKLRKSKALNSQQNASLFKIIEMGESGQIVSFLMTPEEIAAEDAEKRRHSELRRKSSIDDKQIVAYEMAESGALIEFLEGVIDDHTLNIAKIESP